MKPLTDKQISNKLDNHYKEYYGIRNTDDWYINPAPNIWKFERDGEIIILTCDRKTGKVTERKN